MSLKVKSLPKGIELKGKKLKTPNGVIGYYFSSFNSGIFLSEVPEGQEGTDKGRLYPQIADSIKDVLDWEIIEDESVKVNCNVLTSLQHTINKKA
jgi:hypothetical protein